MVNSIYNTRSAHGANNIDVVETNTKIAAVEELVVDTRNDLFLLDERVDGIDSDLTSVETLVTNNTNDIFDINNNIVDLSVSLDQLATDVDDLTAVVGTKANTTALANYLPLTGGTLTGNLNGVTPTQLGYLNSLSSNVQTQINSKAGTSANNTYTGSNVFQSAFEVNSAGSIDKKVQIQTPGGGFGMSMFNVSNRYDLYIDPQGDFRIQESNTVPTGNLHPLWYNTSDASIGLGVAARPTGGGIVLGKAVTSDSIINGATATEMGYLSGTTSSIQTQLNSKAATSALSSYLPLAGGTMTGNLNGVTPTQIGYLNTLSSNVQTQIDGKLSLAGGTMTGNLNGVTPTQIGYLNTLSSNVQTQLNAKAATSALSSYLPLAGGTMTGNLNGVTPTQLGYLSTLTSNVQTQLNAKADTASIPAAYHPKSSVLFEDDFATSSLKSEWGSQGTIGIVSTPEAGSWGVVTITGPSFSRSNIVVNRPFQINNDFTMEMRVKVNQYPNSSTNQYTGHFGLVDANITAYGDPDPAGIYYSLSTTGVTGGGFTPTVSGNYNTSGASTAVNTWVRLKIAYTHSTGTAVFSKNDVVDRTFSGLALSSSTWFYVNFQMLSSSNIPSSNILSVDWVRFQYTISR